MRHVALVPVQELEAWLLLEEAAIRRVAENPAGKMPLKLPSPTMVEKIARPKEKLDEAIILASELTGRRREKFVSRLSEKRAVLIRRLDPSGPVSQVPAWQRLQADLRALVADLAADGF